MSTGRGYGLGEGGGGCSYRSRETWTTKRAATGVQGKLGGSSGVGDISCIQICRTRIMAGAAGSQLAAWRVAPEKKGTRPEGRLDPLTCVTEPGRGVWGGGFDPRGGRDALGEDLLLEILRAVDPLLWRGRGRGEDQLWAQLQNGEVLRRWE